MAKKTFDNFLEEVKSKFGEDVIPEPAIKSISTGSPSLDICTEIGGIPMGRVTTLYGAPGAGKTTLALSIAREAVQSGNNVLYVDAENKLDIEYAEYIVGAKHNQKDEKFIIVQPNTAEDALNVLGLGIESKKFSLVILDSVGALAPKKEKDEVDFEKRDVALIPSLFTKFVRIYFHQINANNVAVVIVNQVRAKIGSYVGGYSTPGGYALEHASSLNIMLSKAEDLKEGDAIVGNLVKYVIKKNSNGKSFRTNTYPLIYGKGIDKLKDIVNFAKELGVITLSGPLYKFEDEKLGLGLQATLEYLSNSSETLDKIKKMCYNTVNKLNLFELEE